MEAAGWHHRGKQLGNRKIGTREREPVLGIQLLGDTDVNDIYIGNPFKLNPNLR
jgi:hypothetical protein